MAFVTLVRRLLRHKILLALAAVAAIAVGLVMSYKVKGPFDLQSKQYSVGVASARILVDTPSSQIVDLGDPQPDKAPAVDIGTLSARAQLLASLMTSSPIKDDIARAAGVEDGTLLTPSSSGAAGGGGGGLAGDISATSPEANILKASVPELSSGSIPIIAVETQAPDADTAAKLADQSVVILRQQLDSLAGTEAIPAARRVTIRELGPARSTTQVRGPSRTLAIAATLGTFLVGCGLILLLQALVDNWRDVTEEERRVGTRRSPAWLTPVTGPYAGDEPDDVAAGDDDEAAEPEVVPAPTREAAGIAWPSTRRHDAG
jgi:hypothetical protein